ncbi:MAG: hypothetical protein ACOC32_01265 [Nanoarchaeota archaeon]
MKTHHKVSVFVLLFLVLAASALAYDVIVFEDYETSYFLKDGKLEVENDVVLKNVGSNPIIPGEIHFRIYSGSEKVEPAKVSELVAMNNNNELDTRIEEYSEYADIVVHVWNPVLPGFEFPISISYDVDFRPKGVLFPQIVFPVEETTVPVREKSVRVMIPERYSITYAPGADLSSDSLYDIAAWDDDDEPALEYSILPFPRMPFRMVSIFWLTVLIILGAVFIMLNLRRPGSKKKK